MIPEELKGILSSREQMILDEMWNIKKNQLKDDPKEVQKKIEETIKDFYKRKRNKEVKRLVLDFYNVSYGKIF